MARLFNQKSSSTAYFGPFRASLFERRSLQVDMSYGEMKLALPLKGKVVRVWNLWAKKRFWWIFVTTFLILMIMPSIIDLLTDLASRNSGCSRPSGPKPLMNRIVRKNKGIRRETLPSPSHYRKCSTNLYYCYFKFHRTIVKWLSKTEAMGETQNQQFSTGYLSQSWDIFSANELVFVRNGNYCS